MPPRGAFLIQVKTYRPLVTVERLDQFAPRTSLRLSDLNTCTEVTLTVLSRSCVFTYMHMCSIKDEVMNVRGNEQDPGEDGRGRA